MDLASLSPATRVRARDLARQSLGAFTAYTMPWFRWNWHHQRMIGALEAAIRGEFSKIILVAPPRHTKSEFVSRRLPAFLLGQHAARMGHMTHHPKFEAIAMTYDAGLAANNGRDVLRIMKSKEYNELFGDVFTGTRTTPLEFATKPQGSYLGRGILQGTAGRGANLFIIDDPIKNRADAESAATLDRIWGAFGDDVLTRLEAPYLLIVMATRWHHNDLTGRLLASQPGEWEYIHFPLISDWESGQNPWYDVRTEPGVPLWPDAPMWFNDPKLKTFEARYQAVLDYYEEQLNINGYGAVALYQGRPVAKGGLLFNEDLLHYYSADRHTAAAKLCTEIVISIDAAFGKSAGGSEVGIAVVGRTRQGERLLLDDLSERMTYPEMRIKALEIFRTWSQYRPKFLIETKANGQALIDELQLELGPRRVIGFNPDPHGPKPARAGLLANSCAKGQFLLPMDQNHPRAGAIKRLFLDFGTISRMDLVDACAQADIYFAGEKSPVQRLMDICRR